MSKETPKAFNSADWSDAVSRYLKKRKELHVMSYRLLAERLEKVGIVQAPESLSAKFNRGTLSAQLFIACLLVMNDDQVDLKELETIYNSFQIISK